MTGKAFFVSLLIVVLASAVSAQLPMQGRKNTLDGASKLTLQVNNWILAKPNGRPVTTMDLAKRIEVMFRQDYPQLAESPRARYQFYRETWRMMLDQMINTELILADAEEKQVEVNDGEIRRRMEEMFGPSVVTTIDEVGLTFDEAWEMVRSELIVQRMQGFMIAARAFTSVNPARLQEAYDELVQQHEGNDEWHYRVLSIRHQNEEKAADAAEVAQLLVRAMDEPDLVEARKHLEEMRRNGEIDIHTSIRVSQLETRSIKSLAESHKKTLMELDTGEFSSPEGLLSRHDRCMVYRIFHLIDYVENPPPPFHEVEGALHNQLVNIAMGQEQQRYINRLRDHFGINSDYLDEMIPTSYEPFSLG